MGYAGALAISTNPAIPADLTTNKALTIADRQEARDVYDIVSLSKTVPIAAAIIAAPAKDPGYTPESLIAAMKRNIVHPQVAFDGLRSDGPIDRGDLLRELRQSLAIAVPGITALSTTRGGRSGALGRERTRSEAPVSRVLGK